MEDARQVTRRPPGGQDINGFKVARKIATGQREVRGHPVCEVTEPTPAVLAAEADERAVRRAAKQAEKAQQDAERQRRRSPRRSPRPTSPRSLRRPSWPPRSPRAGPAKPAAGPRSRRRRARRRGATSRPRPSRPPRRPRSPLRPSGRRDAREAPRKPTPGQAAPAGVKPAREAVEAAAREAVEARGLEAEPRRRRQGRTRGQWRGRFDARARPGPAQQVAAEHPGDKDLAEAVDAVNKAIDVKSFAENPTGFVAGKIKAELIQGVFNRASKSLNAERRSWEERFPAVGTLQKDPLDAGVSLDAYQKNHAKALAGLRVPSARKALLYTFVLMGLDPDAPKEEIERRLRLADQQLAKMPAMAQYIAAYNDAKDRYNFALASVTNQLGLLGDEMGDAERGEAGG